jgi:hypothetical protein
MQVIVPQCAHGYFFKTKERLYIFYTKNHSGVIRRVVGSRELHKDFPAIVVDVALQDTLSLDDGDVVLSRSVTIRDIISPLRWYRSLSWSQKINTNLMLISVFMSSFFGAICGLVVSNLFSAN